VTFKVGDIVVYLHGSSKDNGSEGVITAVGETWMQVKITNYSPESTLRKGEIYSIRAEYLKLVKPEDVVNDPSHYGGKDNPYEVIKVAEAWGLDKDAYLFNVLKYIARAAKKGAELQDKKKARYYLDRRIQMDEAEAAAK
jgi:hypothetical protein